MLNKNLKQTQRKQVHRIKKDIATYCVQYYKQSWFLSSMRLSWPVPSVSLMQNIFNLVKK